MDQGFPGAVHKKFDTVTDAEAFVKLGQLAPVYSYQPATTPPLLANSPAMATPPQAATSQSAVTKSLLEVAHQLPAITQPPSSAAISSSKQEPRDWTSVYTDGACRGNGRTGSVAGSGVWFGDGHPK